VSESDQHRVRTVSELRAIVGEMIPAVEVKLSAALDAVTIDFVKQSPFLVLSTANAEGEQDASPKGDGPGFVLIEDERTFVIPDRPGNRLVFGLENILANPHVGVLFLIPGTPETLRINGTAEITRDPALLERLTARGKPAVLGIRVHIEECFFHCAKAFLRSQLWKPESWPERKRISFGKIMAAKLGADADQIDKAIEEDYRTNL